MADIVEPFSHFALNVKNQLLLYERSADRSQPTPIELMELDDPKLADHIGEDSERILIEPHYFGSLEYYVALLQAESIDIDQLIALGIEERLAKRWVKYLARGGSFSKVDDVLKLYGIDSAWVESAAPYMHFVAKSDIHPQIKEREKQTEPIDLNRADTNQLKIISGIGSFYARSIIEFKSDPG